MKHIGILAHSFEGATLCYRTMCLEGVKRLGPHRHPEVTLTGVAMAHMLDAWERGDTAALLRAVERRDALSAGAVAHARDFSWQATGDGLLATNRDALADTRSAALLARGA